MQSKGYSQEWLELLKSKNDIVNVISDYVKLEKKGKNYWGCCPFHHEKTPSFSINSYDGYYHCFGCGESGDVINFIQKIESIDFLDSVKLLATKSGMEIPAFTGSDEILKKKKDKEKMLEVLSAAKEHYKENLLKPFAKEAQDYLRKRNLTGREIKNFELGYSQNWKEIITYLKSKGYSSADLKLAGVLDIKDGNEFDFFGGRLIFPIINSFGDCIGFSGRVLGHSDFAKYKNSAQSLVFDKSTIVYGINLIKNLKKESGLSEIIIVEGQMDVIAMHRAGFSNTVACLGTALTLQHAKALKRFVDKVVVCFDGDGAGQKATLRSLDILKEVGLEVFVVSLPEGKDPDEVLRDYGKEHLENLIKNATYVTEFLLNSSAAKYNLDKPEEKTKYLKEALQIISKLETNSERETYISLVSKTARIPTDILRKDIDKIDIKEYSNTDEKTDNASFEDANIKAVQFIAASHLYKKPWADYDSNLLTYIKNGSIKYLLDVIIKKKQEGKDFQVGMIFDYFDMENEFQLKQILDYNFESTDQIGQQFYQDCKSKLITTALKQEQQTLAKQYSSETDSAKRAEIAKQINEIMLKLKNKNF